MAFGREQRGHTLFVALVPDLRIGATVCQQFHHKRVVVIGGAIRFAFVEFLVFNLKHMAKEEDLLFPFIAALESAVDEGGIRPPAPFGTVANPIHVMEAEHEFVGDAMAEMRHLTGGFGAPDDACETYRVCLRELEAFERDLHDHVHLENNVLFPKAAALEGRSQS